MGRHSAPETAADELPSLDLPTTPPSIPPALSELDTTAELRAIREVSDEVATAVQLASQLTEDGPYREITAAEFLAARASLYPAPRRTRSAEKALQRRPLWRRSPAIPAVAATLAVCGIGGALHTVGLPGASAANASAVRVDLSGLVGNGNSSASSGAAGTDTDTDTSLTGSAGRVSRSSRGLHAAAGTDATALPARPTLPKVQPGKTVLGTWVRPSAGGESSCFCMRWGVMHDGVDLAGPLGSPIVAVGDGTVIAAGPAEGFGHWIVIQHANGDVSVYGHMYTVLVTVGQHVTAGEHIADIGADGQSTGPHLHFGVKTGLAPGATEAQVLNGGKYIDPVPWLKARGIDVGPYNPNA